MFTEIVPAKSGFIVKQYKAFRIAAYGISCDYTKNSVELEFHPNNPYRNGEHTNDVVLMNEKWFPNLRLAKLWKRETQNSLKLIGGYHFYNDNRKEKFVRVPTSTMPQN